MLGMFVVLREARRVGENTDYYWDMLIIGLVAGVVRARIYYVIFAWDNYKDNLLEIFNTRHGDWRFTAVSSGSSCGFYLFQSKRCLL